MSLRWLQIFDSRDVKDGATDETVNDTIRVGVQSDFHGVAAYHCAVVVFHGIAVSVCQVNLNLSGSGVV